MNSEHFVAILTIVGGVCLCALSAVLHKLLCIVEYLACDYNHGAEKTLHKKCSKLVEEENESEHDYTPSYHNQPW